MDTFIEHQVLDAVEASIYWKDKYGKYLGCNKYMAAMANMKKEDIIGKTDYELPWKDKADQIKKIDELVMKNDRHYEVEEETLNRVYLSSKSPLRDKNNNVSGVIGASIDITHNKKFEKQFLKTENNLNEYLQIKERFLRNVSHEARIPMGSVLSLLESLNDNWSSYNDDFKKEAIDTIFQEAGRLSQFLINTFDMSRFVKGQITPKFTKNNLSQVVRDICKHYQQNLDCKKTEIKIGSFEDYNVVFDKNMIFRVLDNLLMNAVRYSPQGKTIYVNLKKEEADQNGVPVIRCEIIDEGISIPTGELEKIFGPFSESTKTASNACGVGLGLSICKEIISLHSGEIHASKNPNGNGSRFCFTIPTILFPTSISASETSEKTEDRVIVFREKSKIYHSEPKREYGLVLISPFNNYFSNENISDIFEWTSKHYESFGVFFPDKISRYTLQALGYEDSRVNRKVSKQDNYTFNKITKQIEAFQDENPAYPKIHLHNITSLEDDETYQQLHKIYTERFFSDKVFRDKCLNVTNEIIQSNLEKKEMKINDYEQRVANYTGVQYLLSELPAMINMHQILNIKSYDAIYHTVSDNLEKLLLDPDTVTGSSRFLVLK